MSVQVTYEASCDQKFKDDYQNAFYAWVNTAGNAIIQTSAGAVEFDQAHVLNGLHPTTSQYDPNPSPHVTIRFSNAPLRAQRAWYILHWRPDGGSTVLPNPDNEASNDKRRQKRKEKKRRQQDRKKQGDDKDKDRDGGKGGRKIRV